MKIRSEQPKVVVVGSCSIDLVINTEKYPQPNETVMASKSESFFGGKGANQAVAAARLGASVHFVGCVGMDPKGQQILRHLVDEGINVGFVAETEEAETGAAYVTAANGMNAIVVVPAANHHLSAAHIDEAERHILAADMLLLQLEIPADAVMHTVELAKKHGRKLGIYAAPAMPLPQHVLDYACFIVAKTSELHTVFGGQDPEEVLRKMPNKLFLRDDTNSTVYFDGTEMKYFRNDPKDFAHKMGMGDAFTAGFAIAMCHGNSTEKCVKFGNEVSLKVARNRGSQQGLPMFDDFY